MSDRALLGPRRLTLEVPAYNAVFVPDSWPNAAGWENQSSTDSIMFEGSLDLSGYELDKLTLVPQGSELQDPGRYTYTLAAGGIPSVDVEVLDIISQERLDLTAVAANLSLGNVPGMLASTENFTQIIMGNYRSMVVANTNAVETLMTPISGNTFGSGEATAASRLWVYRIVKVNGVIVPADTLAIPASRFILVGTVVDEDELPYMMRLKRSFELSTQG